MKSKLLLSLALTLTVVGSSSLYATTIDATATQPTVGANDVYNYVTPSTHSTNDDFTNNYSNGGGDPGQTFTVTSSGSITAITIEGLQGNAGNGYQNGAFTLGVYSVGSDGTDLTYLGGGSFTLASTSTDYSGDYLTFDLSSSISVTSGDVYAFAVSNQSGYYALAGSGTSGNVYAGGSAIAVGGVTPNGHPITLGADTTISSGSVPYDRNFDVHISEVPEPSTWAMMLGGLVFLVAWQRRRLQS